MPTEILETICPFDEAYAVEDADRQLHVWETAFAWITDCVINHAECQQEKLLATRKWPRRLIAVGENKGDVRLIESTSLADPVSYVTLSHCWGPKGVPLKLLGANHSALSKKIPIAELSPTFVDAINFTRKLRLLGVQYIWIDALCIVQDSQVDKADQIIIMGDIYTNAFLNLAACTGSDGTSGLYPRCDGISRHICHLTMGPDSCIPGSFAVRDMDILKTDTWINSILYRAWCVQELKLARRVLYFGQNHAVWDCATLCAEDMAPAHDIRTREGYTFTGRQKAYKEKPADNKTVLLQAELDPSGRSIFDYYGVWNDIVREYSHCALTYHTDRLIAISGIARAIHSHLGPKEEYVAGLWKNYLPYHLMWHVNTPVANHRLHPFRAPSWSWACIESRGLDKAECGGVYNHLTNAEAISNSTPYLQASTTVTLANNDPFGAIKAATLHVKGPLFKAYLGERGPKSSHLCYLYTNLDDNGHERRNLARIWESPIKLDFSYPGTKAIPVHCLLVMNAAIPGTLAGLILVPHDESGVRGRYIRIGISYNLPSRLLALARGPWRPKSPTEYEEEVGGGDCRISII
jgi:hypothetical protein